MSSPAVNPPDAAEDWRTEIRRRLDKRAGKTTPEPEAPVSMESTDGDGKTGGAAPATEVVTPKPIFSYEMKQSARPDVEHSRPRVKPKIKPKKEAKPKETTAPVKPPLEKPLIRFAVNSEAEEAGPHQRRLELQAPPVTPPIRFDPAERAAEAPQSPEIREDKKAVSREILFSRFLCGIIDCSFPVLTGLGFALLAAIELGLDVFSSESLVWVAGFSAAFFVFNSLFFLLTSGQTLGMYLTELRIVDEDTLEDPPLASVLFRVALFLPVTVTLVGLLWALFDSSRRCFHDIFSGTFVIRWEETPTRRR
ncbi:MAG: RDD family protein [Acidobacteriota bacterium]|nr:MAG: RDD family protein [Acidobacteriota bacterium]